MMRRLLNAVGPQNLRLIALFLVLVLVALFFSTQIDNYLNGRLFNRISGEVAIIALVATGQTLVILTRNVDLSVGSILGFTAFAVGNLVTAVPDINPVLLAGFAGLVGAGFGAVNGFFVAYLRVPAIIVTLGTMAIFRSALVEYCGAKSITSEQLPHWLTDFPNQVLFEIDHQPLRAGFGTALVVVIVVQLALSYLKFARRFYAMGSNPEAAETAGINTRATGFAAFVLCGLFAGLAGFMFLARFGNITVVAGLGFELQSVAAAVVGGVNIFGGSGSVIGALIGAVLVNLIDTSLVRWPLVTEFWREAVLGALILTSVTVDALLARRLIAFRTRREQEAGAESKRVEKRAAS
jgi:rhamnose transport system permease protein